MKPATSFQERDYIQRTNHKDSVHLANKKLVDKKNSKRGILSAKKKMRQKKMQNRFYKVYCAVFSYFSG